MAVHSTLDPGLLESAYEKALCRKFENRKLQFRRQTRISITYDGVDIANAFTGDFIVEDLVIVETKSVEIALPVHRTQARSYLKSTKLGLALILNFEVAHMRDGIVRIANAPKAEL